LSKEAWLWFGLACSYWPFWCWLLKEIKRIYGWKKSLAWFCVGIERLWFYFLFEILDFAIRVEQLSFVVRVEVFDRFVVFELRRPLGPLFPSEVIELVMFWWRRKFSISSVRIFGWLVSFSQLIWEFNWQLIFPSIGLSRLGRWPCRVRTPI
jgi:hypothetical protein